jgi:hypothetical protein
VKRLIAALAIGALSTLALCGDGQTHPNHIIYCDGWVADDKLGLDAFTWTADLSCDNGAMDIASMGVWRERAQFSTTNPIDWHVEPILPVVVGLEYGVPSIVRSQTIYVTPYFGINCRRVKSLMAANHGNTVIILRQSGGECY